MTMYLFFDTETTGVPAGADNIHMVQLAWILADDTGKTCASADFIVRPDGFVIPDRVAEIHGITQAIAMTEGHPLDNVLCPFVAACYFPVRLVAHNIDFDLKIVRKEFERLGWDDALYGKETLCTMRSSADLCDIRPPRLGGKLKPPKLGELYRRLFDEDFENAHNARADIEATARCFWELRRMGVM
jgi:DNA polymerase-3 subunit epsilon